MWYDMQTIIRTLYISSSAKYKTDPTTPRMGVADYLASRSPYNKAPSSMIANSEERSNIRDESGRIIVARDIARYQPNHQSGLGNAVADGFGKSLTTIDARLRSSAAESTVRSRDPNYPVS